MLSKGEFVLPNRVKLRLNAHLCWTRTAAEDESSEERIGRIVFKEKNKKKTLLKVWKERLPRDLHIAQISRALPKRGAKTSFCYWRLKSSKGSVLVLPSAHQISLM